MPHHDSQSGMTLVELLVATAMMSILMVGIYQLFEEHNLMAARQEESTRMEQDLLSILTLTSEDMRMCGFKPAGGDFGFNSTNTNTTAVMCTKDWDGDGILDANSNETAGYRFSTNSIQRYEAQNGTWETIAPNIATMQFAYFDSSGAALAMPGGDITAIRTISISATATPASTRSGMHISNRTMTTRVTCRNFGQ